MPKLLPAFALVVLAFVSSPSSAQQMRQAPPAKQPGLFSQTSIEKAWAIARQKQQPILVMFTSDNCIFCKKMLAETYSHPGIQRLLAAKTQTVLAHKNDYEGLVKKLGIRGYPSSVLVSPKGDVLEFMEGFLPPKDFAERVTPVLYPQARQARAPLPRQTAGR